MHLTEKLLYGEGTFDKFCSVEFLHKIFTYSSRAPKAREKNVGYSEIAPQAKIFLKNAYFLEIFNENLTLFTFLGENTFARRRRARNFGIFDEKGIFWPSRSQYHRAV